MLRYLYARELGAYPVLAAGMFRDRAAQFSTRLGWEVSVNAAGEERDAYDALDPLYVIWQGSDGRHLGSMRFLPTRGPTMLNDHFGDLLEGQPLRDGKIWECTRFCLAPGAGAEVSAALMLGGAEVGRAYRLNHAAGVFDARMIRIYRRLGWGPVILGSRGQGRDRVSLGLWPFSEPIRRHLARRAGIDPALSAAWFNGSRLAGEPLAQPA
ncbi:Acyl-homoserine-lactone synthase [Pseudoruegeria aquimaris]|uniref:Acyl-homoserine-lactone synthase n=1 Tax=Pseudoruegeria aquimaris TaxID=393663 RepID=A0A1Y5SSR2_9RHOB|nr:acyl-homoserine-lactone synthase [Pseudoruegeria aquimaris]SLN46130.1 Acyl-homoserine-lactone synthase [Pseudoruegeria aquimaris]